MSTQNGTIDQEAARKALENIKENPGRAMPQAVNLDEVAVEIIPVKFREYEEEALCYDDGAPLLDSQGNQRMRRVPRLRTALIQNLVPVDAYHHAMQLQGMEVSEAEGIEIMTSLVLEVWQISEPWMERKELTEGIDLPVITELFTRFFTQANQLPGGNPLPAENTTHGEEGEAAES